MENYDELKKYVNILLVDDDLDYIQVTAFFLKSKGYNVDVATSGADAINKVSKGDIHIVLLDYYMPELTGEDVVNKIREFNDRIIIILQTGFAGQQPPEETLKRLNIQNYHDKSDGVEKLLLQVMAAVRIFNQQNQIELSKYRISAIGKLVKGVAEELKTPILSIGAGMEATKTLIDSLKSHGSDEDYSRITEVYNNSKVQIERIDKICKTIINQSEGDNNDVGITAGDIISTLKLMISNDLRAAGIILDEEITVKESKFIYGKIDDVIFIMCELIHKLIAISKPGERIKFSFKENEKAWYLSVGSENIDNIEKANIFLVKSIINRIEGIGFEEIAGQYVIELKKVEGK